MSLFILFCLIFQRGYSQFDNSAAVIAPAPNSMSILKQVSTPVNLYSGIMNVSAPVYTIKGRGYEVPIVLSYNASGIKVQDVAGNVGLGWAISTNCLITRVVNGLPDEQTNGYFGSDMGAKVTQAMTVTTLNGVRDGDLDGEPDLFYFNINGLGGKFVFDKDKNPIMLNDKSISVINSPFKQEMGINGWVLSDLYGNRFFLGTDAGCFEETQSIAYGELSNKTQNFISSWYLKKITLANQTEDINFNYETGSQITTVYYRKAKRTSYKVEHDFRRPLKILGITIVGESHSQTITELESKEINNDIHQTVASPKYLTSIISSNQSAYFSYDLVNLRKDLTNGRALNKIEIKDNTGVSLRVFRLNYDYVFSHDVDEPEDVSTTTPDKYRLLLSGIDVAPGSDQQSFLPMFKFQYNSEYNLPPRYSRRVDHWGYFNNNTYGFFPDKDNISAQIVSKSPDPDRSQANILKRIIYETGGYKEFVYEGNQFFNTKTGSNNQTGGIRIAQIISSVGVSSPKTYEKYKYEDFSRQSSGKIIKLNPIYNVNIDNTQSFSSWYRPRIDNPYTPALNPDQPNEDVPNYTVPAVTANLVPHSPIQSPFVNYLVNTAISYFANPGPTTVFYSPTSIRNFNTYNSLFDLEGCFIGYSRVTVSTGEGISVNNFTDLDDYPDYSNQVKVNSQFTALLRLAPDVSPFTPQTSYGFARGHLKERMIYDANGKLLSLLTNKYEFEADETKVTGFKCESAKVNTTLGVYQSKNSDYFNVGYYDLISKSLLLKETEEKVYENTDKFTTTLTKYYYNSANPTLLSGQNTYNSDGTNLIQEYKYVLNKDQVSYSIQSETDAANDLYSQKRFGVLLEQITKRDNQTINTSKTGYKNWTIGSKQLILPSVLYSGKGSVVYPEASYNAYDEYGNFTQLTKENGISKIVKWGYNNLYPILECLNAGLADVYHEDFETSSGSGISSGMGHSGTKYYSGQYTVNFSVGTGKLYDISYWYYSVGSWHFSGYLAYAGPSMVLNNGTAIDDIVIAPKNAQASISDYSLSVGLVSQTDAKGLSSYYEYDALQRLLNIKDADKNVVKSYAYNYRSPLFVSTKSAFFTKNDCPSTNQSLPIKYSTTFTSNISQADADNLADNDLLLNGQDYANKNSVCNLMNVTLVNRSPRGIPVILKLTNTLNPAITYTLTTAAPNSSNLLTVPDGNYTVSIIRPPDGIPPTILFNLDGQMKIGGDGLTFSGLLSAGATLSYTDEYYYNTVQSGIFTKNDCANGKFGSDVLYTVPPGIYLSDISQLNADAKAKYDIYSNGQSYANTNGSCKSPGEAEVSVVNNGSAVGNQVIVVIKQSGTTIQSFSFTGNSGTERQVKTLPDGVYSVEILIPGSGVTKQFTVANSSQTGNPVSFSSVSINGALVITIN